MKWYHMQYCSTLYQWSLTEEAKSHPDYEEVLDWLSKMEKIKPHHLDVPLTWDFSRKVTTLNTNQV